MSSENERTVDFYEKYASLYCQRNEIDYATTRGQKDDKIHTDYIVRSLAGVPKSARMFEVGSGSGRDARLIRSLGYEIQVSDVADSFLKLLSGDGFEPIKFDLTRDNFSTSYDYILANAVLVHFTKDEVKATVAKIYEALNPKGIFVLSLKQRLGGGEEWKANIAGTSEKRYFSYWEIGEAKSMLEAARFRIIECRQNGGMRACWLDIICQK